MKDLEGFSHIILIYHLHLSKGHALQVKPFLDNQKHGIFLLEPQKDRIPLDFCCTARKINDSTVYISNVDIIDGTPLLDIKPYIPHFDKHEDDEITIGWFEERYLDAIDKKV